jgi:predicted nucleic acid-binding protein
VRPRVLDASAIIALYQAHPPVFHLLTQAHDGELTIAVPAVALAEANITIRASNNDWEAVLLTGGFTVLPLAQHVAIEISELTGDLATRHVVHEARSIQGLVVTCEPELYAGNNVPVIPV